MEELPIQIKIYLTTFLDMEHIAKLCRLNKYWRDLMQRDQVNLFSKKKKL